MNPGDRDGYGRFAVLDVDDDGRLICHECGRSWAQLATHVLGTHGITADDYRDAHGLGSTTRLVAAGTRARLAEAYDRHRDVHIAALDRSRDPARARQSARSTTGEPWAPEVRAKRSEVARRRRGRPLTDRERARLDAAGIDLQRWADVARELLTLDGVTSRSLAEAADIGLSTVAQRLRRYPQRR